MRITTGLKPNSKSETARGPSTDEYRTFREDLETLSEKVGLLRNHFYNHAFNDGTLLKVVEVQKIAEKLYGLVQLLNTR